MAEHAYSNPRASAWAHQFKLQSAYSPETSAQADAAASKFFSELFKNQIMQNQSRRAACERPVLFFGSHGAAMCGPGYAWWHGIYDVAKNFYTEFLSEVKQVAGPELYGEIVKKYLESDVRHEWFTKGMSKEQLEKMQKFYSERYGGATANWRLRPTRRDARPFAFFIWPRGHPQERAAKRTALMYPMRAHPPLPRKAPPCP